MFRIRTDRGRLFLYNTCDAGGAYSELSAAAIVAQLDHTPVVRESIELVAGSAPPP